MNRPPANGLDEATMLNPWFKDYADRGHWFNTAHTECLRCGAPTIDLYEDGVYGDIRQCTRRFA
jgi:hypothetical protein